MNQTSIKSIQEKGMQKGHGLFTTAIVNEMNENKKEYYGQKLPNGMTITGIGKKCLKIENNFYTWEDIENLILYEDEETDDPILQNIINYLFEDSPYTGETDTYTPRKFTRTEAINKFDEIKQEIIENKQYYRRGTITGIGNDSLMTGIGYEKQFITWDEIRENLMKESILDYRATHLPDIYTDVVTELFCDDNNETNVEVQEAEYKEQKEYTYRHIISEDLTVENIRAMIYNTCEGSVEEKEEIIETLLQYAFQYTQKIQFTTDPITSDDEKYAIKNGGSYVYTHENPNITYNEEEATLEDAEWITFKAVEKYLQIYRDGKKVSQIRAGQKPVYLRRGDGETITLSPQLQVDIFAHLSSSVERMNEEDVKNEFLKYVSSSHSEVADEIRDAITVEQIKDRYDSSLVLRGLARMLYKADGMIHGGIFNSVINSVRAESHVTHEIVDTLIWDESTGRKAQLLDDKYQMNDRQGKHVTLAFTTYTYTQNCEYTRISHTSTDVDTFTVEDVYVRGSVDEEEIPVYFEYAMGMYFLENELKKGYIYEDGNISMKI